ncbi:MAG: NB-ARC domain-containing protein [Caldilineaceae bacterium]
MTTTSVTQPAILTIDGLEEKVLQAFRLWHANDHEGSPLQALQSYQLICNRNICNNGQSTMRLATNELLRRGLDALRVSHPDEHTILVLRFAEEQPVQVVANRMNLAEGSVLRKQQQGIRHVAETLYYQERQTRQTQRERLFMRLPSPTTPQLWGTEKTLDELTPVLLPGQAPWVVMIEGAAGVGKSALTDALCRRLIDSDLWEEFAWVALEQTIVADGATNNQAIVEQLLLQLAPDTLQNEEHTAETRLDLLCNRLKERPHLIVIDGLEAHPDIDGFMSLLHRMINPSKIVITSRLRAYQEAGVYHFTLGAMTAEHTLQLIREEAKLRNLRDVAEASDEELYPIYTLIGGNPLAARVVVEQLHIYPLNQVLADLITASGPTINDLYAFLFDHAWEQLDEAMRYASLPLLLITEKGDTLEELVLTTQNQANREEVRRALEVYVKLGLLDVKGNFIERRYVMHHLTRTFLRQQIIRWILGMEHRPSDYTIRFEQFVKETLLRISELIYRTDKSPSRLLIEKTKYLMEYAFQFDPLGLPALNLLLFIAPMLEIGGPGQSWLPVLKKALQVCQQRGDGDNETRIRGIIQPVLPQRPRVLQVFSKLLPEQLVVEAR